MKDNITLISFTSDMWGASVCLMSMLSLTAQSIDQILEINKVVLCSQEFLGSHTDLTNCLEETAGTDHRVKVSKATLLEEVQKRFHDIESECLYTITTSEVKKLHSHIPVCLCVCPAV